MDGFELNKIAAAVLITGLIMMVSGTVAEALYFKDDAHSDEETKRGFEIAVAEQAGGEAKEEVAPIPFEELLAAADIGRGEKVAKKCASCHSFDKGGPNKVGPNLWDIVNAKFGAKDGFAYSSALTGFQAASKWDYDALNQFIAKPQAYMKGTKMSFAGIRKDTDRAALIQYLATLSDSPKALP